MCGERSAGGDEAKRTKNRWEPLINAQGVRLK